MRTLSKCSLGLLSLAFAGMLSAQEVISLAAPADFNQPKLVIPSEDSFLVKSRAFLQSAKFITLDPAKKYQISGEFCMKGGNPNRVYLGFMPFDDKGKWIPPNVVNGTNATLTEVVADAKKGDQVIKVKDASKWNTKTIYSHLALGAKADYSDLPNRDLIATAQPNAQQKDGVWEILLKKPLAKDIPAGTTVRQQLDGGAYIYTAGTVKLTDQWVTRKGTISGIAKFGNPGSKIWKGTAKLKVIILLTEGDQTSETLFRNIKVTEVK